MGSAGLACYRMPAPARDGSLQDETYLPRENTAEIIDFLSTLQSRGRELLTRARG